MKSHSAHLFLMTLALAVSLTGPSHAQAGSSFFEPFDRLSKTRWFTSSGWANGKHQSCLWHKDRVEIANGKLLLSLTADAKEDRSFSCGEIQTKARYGYGTYEARMQVPFARGMNANLFTFIGAPQDRPHNEIDFEFIAPQGPKLQTNFHTAKNGENTDFLAMQNDGEFRNYAFIWEPDRIRWFIDGKLIRDVRAGTLPNEPQKIYLSLWSTDTLVDWMGSFDHGSAPQTLAVDWLAYTEQGAECGFEQSVLCLDGVDVAQ